MFPPLGTSRWPLEVVGRGFPTWSDLAIRMDLDELLVHLPYTYGAPALCQADSEDPKGSTAEEVPISGTGNSSEGL